MIAIQRGARREKHGKKWERRNWINDMKSAAGFALIDVQES